MLESGSTYQQVADWLRGQETVEQVLSESGEINAKYRNGGWEFWTPGTPPSDEANQGSGFIDFAALNLAAAVPRGKAAIINCCSNESRMEGHKTYLSSAAAFLTATGYTPVPIDTGPNILDRLGSLQE